jgi:DNA-binding SARP family transcriptional activator
VSRRVLGADLFAETGDAEVEIRAGALTCDVCEFERLARAGEAERAMHWYRGDFLPGFFLSDALEFERWMERERLRLQRLASESCWRLADAKAAAGEHAEAGGWARRAADLTPFDEGAVHRLIVLLDALGDRAGALRAYDHFARRLLDEYAAEPSPETSALIARVRGRG